MSGRTEKDAVHTVSSAPDENGDDKRDMKERKVSLKLATQIRVRRIFSSLQIFFFALAYMSSWEAIVGNLVTVFFNGGPVALSWGFLVVFAGALAQSASLAELAAVQPISGAQYHWAAALAPPRYKRVITWFQGWVTWLGWISILAGASNITAYEIQGVVIANYPSYEPQPWHLTLMIFAMLIVQGLMNSYTFRLIPWIEMFSGFLHVILFIIYLVVLVATTKDKHSSDFVFFQSSSSSGWTNQYVIWNLGLMAPTWGFVGFDGVVHMSEETRKAKHAVPRAMFWSIAINGVMAFAMIIAVLFCMGDYEQVLNAPLPILAILVNSTGSSNVATAMCVGLVVMGLATTLGTIASTSRLTWAWARDGALPKYFSYVDSKYHVPIRALWLPVFITMLLALLNIGSTAAFGAFIALSSMGLYSSYIIAIGCMIYTRLSSNNVQLGGWNLGRWGLPINIFAIVYSLYIFVFLPFPTSLPITGPSMNYSLPIFGFVVLFSASTWWLWGRRKWPGLNEKIVEFVLADSDISIEQ